MSEILKEAYARPRAVSQNRFHNLIDFGNLPKYIWDLYPVKETYYHEFNPYFVHLLTRPKLLEFFPVFTVRDGAYAFADFLAKNLTSITRNGNHFLIPETFSGLIPEKLRQNFYSYSFSQNRPADISSAKSVVVFALLCDQYFGSYEKVEEKLRILKNLPADVPLEVCISQRRNPFNIEERENFHYLHIPELIRRAAGDRKIKWVRLHELMERSFFRDTFLLDLLDGNELISDSYLHFRVLSHGGMVNLIPGKAPSSTLFDLDVSLFHQLHVRPLPKSPSHFNELLFVSRTCGSEGYLQSDFQKIVRQAVNDASSSLAKG